MKRLRHGAALRRRALAAAPLLGLVLGAAPAHAAPLNPWGAPVGRGVVALTPFLFVDQQPLFSPLLYVQVGATDRFEVLAGAGASLGRNSSSFDGVEFMPRLFFTDSTGLALHLSWSPGSDPVTAPELHGAYDLGALQLTMNLGWGPSLGQAGFQPGTVYALVAPELTLAGSTSVFLEIDPTWDLAAGAGPAGQRFSLELVPGLSTAIADTHYLCFGLGVPVAPDLHARDLYLGAWYSIAFGGA